MKRDTIGAKFVFEPIEAEPVGSCLYKKHLELTSRMADFAGYLMPLWYESISAEHKAVRQRAGIFDCTHMGVLEIDSPRAQEFINFVTTNDVSKLRPHKAQYSYVLDSAGNILDDIIVYRRAEEKFMLVVNAANEPKIKAWFESLEIDLKPEIVDMRSGTGSGRTLVDIALQGPLSKDILFSLTTDSGFKEGIEALGPFGFIEAFRTRESTQPL